MQVVVMIGFSNSAKEKQNVNAFLNGTKVAWVKRGSEYNGTFATPLAKRMQLIWFLANLDCSHGDVIRLESEVFIRGMGFDEERSRTVEFVVDEAVPPTQFDIRKIGDPKFPLLSGPVTLLNQRSKLDVRVDAAEGLIRESQEQGNLDDADNTQG